MDAFFWITYGSKGERQEHMVLRVCKLSEMPGGEQLAIQSAVPVAQPVVQAQIAQPYNPAIVSGVKPSEPMKR